jgi:hypothetical protein
MMQHAQGLPNLAAAWIHADRSTSILFRPAVITPPHSNKRQISKQASRQWSVIKGLDTDQFRFVIPT